MANVQLTIFGPKHQKNELHVSEDTNILNPERLILFISEPR